MFLLLGDDMPKKRRTSIICNDWIAYTNIMDDATAWRLFKCILAIRNWQCVDPPEDLKFILAHIQDFWREVDEEYAKKSSRQREKALKRRNKSDPDSDLLSQESKSDATAYDSIPLNATDANQCQECLTGTNTNTNKKNIYLEIYNTRNNKNITQHKKLNEEIKKSIEKILQDLSESEVIQAIENYATIYHSDKTYFKHKWTLSEFLSRKNGARVFLYKSEEDYLDKDKKQPKKNENYSTEARDLQT